MIKIRAKNRAEYARGEYYAQGYRGAGAAWVLEELARRGPQQMLAQAMEAEVALFVEKHADKVDENGHREVVRNGHMPARELVTGIGRVPIKQLRVDNRQLAKQGEERFSSAILPRYLKRVASVDSLIPALYLKGVSTGNFSEALKAILGKGAPGLSANSVVRLKAVWEQEYQEWTRRSPSGKRYVYFWADGLHVNVRLNEERNCILVIMAADEHGNKGSGGGQRRLSGEHGILARDTVGSATTGTADRSAAGDGGRSAGVLDGIAGGVSGYERNLPCGIDPQAQRLRATCERHAEHELRTTQDTQRRHRDSRCVSMS